MVKDKKINSLKLALKELNSSVSLLNSDVVATTKSPEVKRKRKKKSEISIECEAENAVILKLEVEPLVLPKAEPIKDLETEIQLPKVEISKKQNFLEFENEDAKLTYFENEVNALIGSNADDNSLRKTILLSDVPLSVKVILMKRYNSIERLESSSSEYIKHKNWIDCVLDLPFGKSANLFEQISVQNNIEIGTKLHLIQKKLNNKIYGLKNAKEKVLEYVCKFLVNPDATDRILGLQGSQGVGKTRFAMALADILGLKFFLIPLGGSNDVNLFKGHNFTYEGSEAGIITKLFKQAQCDNFILYLDELDKIGMSDKSSEVYSYLIHLLDPSQNKEIHDNYLGEITLDLSHVFFILSFNDPSKIDPTLQDRIYTITIDDPSFRDKVEIARSHLIPENLEKCKFAQNEVIFSDDIIKKIIMLSRIEEKGVRQLNRNIETIISKLNVLRLMVGNNKQTLDLSYSALSKTIKFPLTLTTDHISQLFSEHSDFNSTIDHMYS